MLLAHVMLFVMHIHMHAGEILRGKQALAPPELAGDLGAFMQWVDDKRVLRVLTNADTPDDAAEVRPGAPCREDTCRVNTRHSCSIHSANFPSSSLSLSLWYACVRGLCVCLKLGRIPRRCVMLWIRWLWQCKYVGLVHQECVLCICLYAGSQVRCRGHWPYSYRAHVLCQ